MGSRGNVVLNSYTRLVAYFAYAQLSDKWREWTFRTISQRQAELLVAAGEATPITRLMDGAVHHPNRLPFEGVLTLVDVASDKAPSGARGHRVILTRAAAEAALHTLVGMAVDFKSGYRSDTHNRVADAIGEALRSAA